MTAAVRERPILFSGPMVRAILEGRKTQTRRVVKPQPQGGTPRYAPLYLGPDVENDPTPHLVWQDDPQSYFKLPCPFGSPGDLLYVRETWMESAGYRYLADYGHRLDLISEERARAAWTWKPSIHMPKWAARIWLRVTDVRVERLQEITEADVIAEGMTKRGYWWDAGPNWEGDGIASTAVDAYAALWDSLNADRGYEFARNPWVWVVSFERAEAPRG